MEEGYGPVGRNAFRGGVSFAVVLIFVAIGVGCAPTAPPRPDHVVIVIEENRSFNQIIGNPFAPYINSLAAQGAVFTQSFAITHPSLPNYLHLFSGSDQGVTDDTCPAPGSPYAAPNLGSELIARGFTFAGYSEDLPGPGSTACSSGTANGYQQKHNPWVGFSNVPPSANLPWMNFPAPGSYRSLPTVSIVVPNQLNDMHNGTISQADRWLQANLDAYVQWAKTHNSLLILTFDEDDSSLNNQITTVFVGPMVKPGSYSEHITHHNVLRMIEDMYGLSHAGAAATATPILDVFHDRAADR
jgi:phosphatidylinositol-3-phosphatase